MPDQIRISSPSHRVQGETETQADSEPADAPNDLPPAGAGQDALSQHAENPDREPSRRRADRAGLLVAGTALAACGGLVLYGVLDTGDADDPPERRIPTAAVTYEVTGQGTADIIYQARSETGQAIVLKAAALPWRKTVHVPLGKDPIVNIVLGEKGGQARCALAIRGTHVQSATATGTFGRATCSGTLPRRTATGG
ncbi:hypothetical protein ACFYOV_31375 [Streptomyces sp. NPDC005931]|uniref:hypothetical protein n=1 Tax=Streptomyces sp. NPDC005931 TaxID=3364737 RepID=UPI00369E0B24